MRGQSGMVLVEGSGFAKKEGLELLGSKEWVAFTRIIRDKAVTSR